MLGDVRQSCDGWSKPEITKAPQHFLRLEQPIDMAKAIVEEQRDSRRACECDTGEASGMCSAIRHQSRNGRIIRVVATGTEERISAARGAGFQGKWREQWFDPILSRQGKKQKRREKKCSLGMRLHQWGWG